MMLAGQLLMGSTLVRAAEIAPADLSGLSYERATLLAKIKERDASQSRLAALQSERIAADKARLLAQAKSGDARDNLEKKQAYDRENPGEITTDKLREAEEQNRHAANALKAVKENLSRIDSNIIAANAMAVTQDAEVQHLQQTFDSRLNFLVDKHVQAQASALQVAKVVETKGVVSCGDDGIRVCKDKSKKEAEKNAIEQGSTIDFSSVTEVHNFQLSKEEIRSEVHATLSNEEVLAQKIIDESSAVTEIRVTVNPAISPSLRRRMAEAIREDLLVKLGGLNDVGATSAPQPDAEAAAAQRRDEEQARQAAEKQQAELKQQAKKQDRLVAEEREAELQQQADDARRKQAQRDTESKQKQESHDKWNFVLLAGLNNNKYSAAFTDTFNNKTASSSYLETSLGLTATNNEGYFVAIAATQGSGKHDLYKPAVDQAFKRGSAGLMVGMPASGNPNTRYFLSVGTATIEMAAIGQSWTQDTFASTGLGGGMDFLFPVAVGTFGLNLEGGIKSAKWTDDNGYSASSASAYGGSGRASYSYAFSKRAGVTVDAGMHFYNYKFKAFTVNEKINSIGVSLFAKF